MSADYFFLASTGKEYVVEFDFLGKDSIRYHNYVQVEKRVFKNLQLFMESKKEGDDLFDRLNTSILNEYLSSLMPGLTAKVFRTYNASITLQEQLKKLTDGDDNIAAKVIALDCHKLGLLTRTKLLGSLSYLIEMSINVDEA